MSVLLSWVLVLAVCGSVVWAVLRRHVGRARARGRHPSGLLEAIEWPADGSWSPRLIGDGEGEPLPPVVHDPDRPQFFDVEERLFGGWRDGG